MCAHLHLSILFGVKCFSRLVLLLKKHLKEDFRLVECFIQCLCGFSLHASVFVSFKCYIFVHKCRIHVNYINSDMLLFLEWRGKGWCHERRT